MIPHPIHSLLPFSYKSIRSIRAPLGHIPLDQSTQLIDMFSAHRHLARHDIVMVDAALARAVEHCVVCNLLVLGDRGHRTDLNILCIYVDMRSVGRGDCGSRYLSYDSPSSDSAVDAHMRALTNSTPFHFGANLDHDSIFELHLMLLATG